MNYRMLTVGAVVLALLGYPVLTFVKAELNHGIEYAGDHENVDLKALGNFPFDDMSGRIENVPARFRQLDGKRVALEGFMYPGRAAGASLSEFEFVYNRTTCCLSGPPRVQERVFASVPHGQIDFHDEAIRIFGTARQSAKGRRRENIERLHDGHGPRRAAVSVSTR